MDRKTDVINYEPIYYKSFGERNVSPPQILTNGQSSMSQTIENYADQANYRPHTEMSAENRQQFRSLDALRPSIKH